MKITFVAMGWENIAVEYLSAYLKQQGHKVSLAYEQALWDDKNYLCVPWAARWFDQKDNILKQILDTNPDIVAFSVYSVGFQWAVDCASKLKELLDVPVVFGGSHAMICPERVIAKKPVDIVCIGEGEYAMAELLGGMDRGKIDTSVRGFWFKTHEGEIIKNERQPLIADLDSMPLPDKDLFAPLVPIKNYYLAVTNRGCPYSCTYCSVSYVSEFEKGLLHFKKVRERSVDSVMEELKINRAKYGFRWIDFRNAVFSPSKSWILEFCRRYHKDIRLPFRIFSHPLLIDEDTTLALREAGCFAVQIGLESYDERLRKEVLNRDVSDEQFHAAIRILEASKISYSLDYMLGLPSQEEPELKKAAEFFGRLKYCYRITPFMFSYLPKMRIIDYAVNRGFLDESERSRIEEGLHDNYMYRGSDMPPERARLMNTYRLLFRSMSFMTPRMRRFFYHSGLFRIFRILPMDLPLRLLDLLLVFRDRDARAYVLNYIWWMRKRLDPRHPHYFRNRLSAKDRLKLKSANRTTRDPHVRETAVNR